MFADHDEELLGVNTQKSFLAVLEHIKRHESDIDFILHSGDISQDGSPESYQYLAEQMQQFDCPVYFVPGNHDYPTHLAKSYPLDPVSTDKHIVLDDWQLILLDSQIPGSVPGELKTSQFLFIEECLTTHPDHEAIIVFHHQPVPINTQWLDPLGVQNKDTLWNFLANYPIVTKVLFGHIHQHVEQKVNKVDVYSVPSTCIQFKPDVVEFALDHIPQGYRVVTLGAKGEFKTEVKRLPSYIGNFDEDATGY